LIARLKAEGRSNRREDESRHYSCGPSRPLLGMLRGCAGVSPGCSSLSDIRY
jgi:hypothetical protein